MKALQFNITVPRYVFAKSLSLLFGKQVFFKGPAKTVQIVDIPEPTLPSDQWVKLETLYCGFCGSDLNLICLHDSPTASPFTSFPSVIGHEIVGRITETGADVNGFGIGDVVAINPVLGCEARNISPLCDSCKNGRAGNCENMAEGDLAPGMFTGITNTINGGFAPRFVAHRSQLFKVPDGLSPESAVMVEPLSVALQTLFDNMPKADEKILVIGGGVIGNLIVQSAKALMPDCQVFVIDPSSFAAKLARETGADYVIPGKEIYKKTAKITAAKVYKPLMGSEILMGGFHRIFDTIGSSSTLNLSLRLLKAMGTLSIVGIGSDVKLDLTPLWLKLQTVKGILCYGTVNHNGRVQHVFDVALDLLKKGIIDADILLTHTFSLDDYQNLIDVNLNKSRHNAMKTIVSFDKYQNEKEAG